MSNQEYCYRQVNKELGKQFIELHELSTLLGLLEYVCVCVVYTIALSLYQQNHYDEKEEKKTK